MKSLDKIIPNKTKYNPWEDNKTFIQDVGSLNSFLSYVEENNLSQSISINEENEQTDKLYLSSLKIIVLLKSVNNLSKIQSQKLALLETLYERYRYEKILSREKNENLLTHIKDLSNTFSLLDSNKMKLANLIHNASMTDSNTIKIKHSKKFDLMKVLKVCICDQPVNALDMFNLTAEMHSETINKLKRKNEELINMSERIIADYLEISGLKL